MPTKLIDLIALHPRALRVAFALGLGAFAHFFWRKRRSAGLLALSEKHHETEVAFKVRELLRMLKLARRHYRPEARHVMSMNELQSKRKLPRPGKTPRVKTEAIAVADPRVYASARLDASGTAVAFASQELAYFNLFLDQVSLAHIDDLIRALLRHPDELPPKALSRIQAIADEFAPLQSQARTGSPADRLRLGSEHYAEIRQWQKRLRTVAKLVAPAEPDPAESDDQDDADPAENER